MRELTLPGRLILLPGFGCSHAIFQRQRKAFGDRLQTPDFIPHLPSESIAAYAKRWAHQLSTPGDDRPVFLGGVSLGGMLALEVALHIKPKPTAVFLIGSTTQGGAVSPVMQLVELLSRFVPAKSIPKMLPLLNFGVAMREGLDDDDKGRLLQAAREADPALTKWAAGAAVGWAGFNPPDNTPPADYPPIHQIHSRHDWVIKPPAESADVQWVDGSSHLLNMTHASTVNRFLFDHIIDHCPQAQIQFPAIEDPHTTAERRVVLEGSPAGTPLV